MCFAELLFVLCDPLPRVGEGCNCGTKKHLGLADPLCEMDKMQDARQDQGPHRIPIRAACGTLDQRAPYKGIMGRVGPMRTQSL